MYRIHRYLRSPWWFASDGAARFDLPIPHGTCYLAVNPVAALLEVARGLTILSSDFLAGRRLASASLLNDVNLADLTAPGAYSFGVTAELSATADYTMPHTWARALHAAGFDGVRYDVRHDPSSTLTGIAWLGRAGTRPHPLPGYSRPLPADVLLRAAPYGFGLRPASPRSSQRAGTSRLALRAVHCHAEHSADLDGSAHRIRPDVVYGRYAQANVRKVTMCRTSRLVARWHSLVP